MPVELPNGVTLDQVRRYLDNRTKEFGTLPPLLVAKDSAGIRSVAHRIKGNAALYAMPELGLVAGRLCDAVEGGDWSAVSRLVDGLISRLSEERLRFLI